MATKSEKPSALVDYTKRTGRERRKTYMGGSKRHQAIRHKGLARSALYLTSGDSRHKEDQFDDSLEFQKSFLDDENDSVDNDYLYSHDNDDDDNGDDDQEVQFSLRRDKLRFMAPSEPLSCTSSSSGDSEKKHNYTVVYNEYTGRHDVVEKPSAVVSTDLGSLIRSPRKGRRPGNLVLGMGSNLENSPCGFGLKKSAPMRSLSDQDGLSLLRQMHEELSKASIDLKTNQLGDAFSLPRRSLSNDEGLKALHYELKNNERKRRSIARPQQLPNRRSLSRAKSPRGIHAQFSNDDETEEEDNADEEIEEKGTRVDSPRFVPKLTVSRNISEIESKLLLDSCPKDSMRSFCGRSIEKDEVSELETLCSTEVDMQSLDTQNISNVRPKEKIYHSPPLTVLCHSPTSTKGKGCGRRRPSGSDRRNNDFRCRPPSLQQRHRLVMM